jgi:hypothetical protein
MEKERNQSALIESVLPPVPEAVSIAAITTYPLPFVQPYQASEIVATDSAIAEIHAQQKQ